MPKLGAPFTPTSPNTQAIGTGLPSPPIVFKPGGSANVNGTYLSEALVQQACTASAGIQGPLSVYLDLSANSDAYTTAGDLNLGASTTLVGVVSDGTVPVLTHAYTLVPPVEIRDVVFSYTGTLECFTTNPAYLRLSGQTSVVCSSSGVLYVMALANVLFIDQDASLGDGTNACINVNDTADCSIHVRGTLLDNAFFIVTGASVTIYEYPGSSVGSTYSGLAGVTVIQVGGGGGGGGGGGVFVFDQTLTPGGNIYSDFGLCSAAAKTYGLTNGQPIIYCQNSPEIPAGTYDFGETTLIEIELFGGLTIDDAVIFTNMPLVVYASGGLPPNLQSQAAIVGTFTSAAPFLLNGATIAFFNINFYCGGSSVLIDATGGGMINFYGCSIHSQANGEFTIDLGTYGVLNLFTSALFAGAFSSCVKGSFASTGSAIIPRNGTGIDTNTITDYSGGSVPFVFIADMTSASNIALTQTGCFGGVVTLFLIDESSGLNYFNSAPAFPGGGRLSVQAACDAIKVALFSPLSIMTTSGTVTMALGTPRYDFDTSGNTTCICKFPASPINGQEHEAGDVGGNILDNTGSPTAYTVTIQGNGAQWLNPDTGRLMTASGAGSSMIMSRNYWSYRWRYNTTKGIWS